MISWSGWAGRAATVAGVAVVAAAIDLGAKAAAEAWLEEGAVRGALPFVDLSLSFNHGISFSLFPAHDPSSLALLLAIQGTLTCLVAGWALAAGGTWRRLVTDPASGTVVDVGRARYRPPAGLADLGSGRSGLVGGGV